MKFIGSVKNGKLTLYDIDGFKRHLYNYDGDVELVINPTEKKRSTQQNSYYRILCRHLSKELGYSEYEMHQTLKEHFNIANTKELTQEEFTEYIDLIIRWAATEMGIVLPDPKKSHQ